MPYAVILRGVKMPTTLLDAYLAEHNVEETYGRPLTGDCIEEVAAFLRSKMSPTSDNGDVSVFVPSQRGFNASSVVYLAYDWIRVFAQHEIAPHELPEAIPSSFQHLRQQLLTFAQANSQEDINDDTIKVGTYMLVLGTIDWWPDEVRERNESPVDCDGCDMTFDTFAKRQHHRRDKHDSDEGENPLPNV